MSSSEESSGEEYTDSRSGSGSRSGSYSQSGSERGRGSESRSGDRSTSASQSGSERRGSEGSYSSEYSSEEQRGDSGSHSRSGSEYSDEERGREERSGTPSESDYSGEERGRGSSGDESYTPTGSDSQRSDYSDDDRYRSDSAREIDSVGRRRFAELPQAKSYEDRRLFDDKYAQGLQNYIQQLSHHILTIQKNEVDTLVGFGRDISQGLTQKKEDQKRKKVLEEVAALRAERRQYRGMLYDAIQDRNNLLEARDISKIEERRAKNNADSVEPYSGFDFFLILFFALQIGLIVLYILFLDYTNNPLSASAEIIGFPGRTNYSFNYWVHIAFIVFIGFGLLGGFLRKYSYTALGTNLLIAAFSFQWALLVNGWFTWADDGAEKKIKIESDNIIHALYAAATTVIAYGAVVGRLNPLQSVFFAFWTTFFYCLNFYIGILVLEAADYGGALTIHLFAAIFGVAASWVHGFLDKTPYAKDGPMLTNNQRPGYFGDTFALVGLGILFVFFPSFNAATAPENTQFRVIFNTLVGLTVSACTVFALSWFFGYRNFRAFEIQNAVLSGGIALGSAHSVLIHGWESMFVALVVSIISWAGMRWITNWANSPHRVPRIGQESWHGKIARDTRGIFFGHGVPGFIGGIAGMIALAAYDDDGRLGQSWDELGFDEDNNQAARNAFCWLVSMGISLGAGVAVGLFLYLLEITVPSEHFPGARRFKYRKYHDESAWRELPLDVD